jgi:hypothetical protein
MDRPKIIQQIFLKNLVKMLIVADVMQETGIMSKQHILGMKELNGSQEM